MAIAGIESGWQTRVQVPGGAARSYWQLEQYGAILDVMNDPTASPVVTAFCDAWDIPTDGTTLFDAVAYLDPLAYLIARLALWQVVAPLPAIGDSTGAYNYYLNVWRPGTPRPDAWPEIYYQAVALVP